MNNAPGSSFIRAAGIHYIVYNLCVVLLNIIASFVFLFYLYSSSDFISQYLIAAFCLMITAIFGIVVGALAIKYQEMPKKAMLLLALSIIFIVLHLICWILSGLFVFFVLSLVISILLISGAIINKRALSAPPSP